MGEWNAPRHCQVILRSQGEREGRSLPTHPLVWWPHMRMTHPQCFHAAIRAARRAELTAWTSFFSWNNANLSSFVAFLCGTTLAHPSLWFIWKWNSGKSFAPSGSVVIGRELGTSHGAHKETKRRKPTPNREAFCNLCAQATPPGSQDRAAPWAEL